MLAEPKVFLKLFQCISRFIRLAHFNVSQKGINVKSIDSDDFCYIELFFSPSFFKGYDFTVEKEFGIDVSKFSKFLSKISSANNFYINLTNEEFVLEAEKGWNIQFRINFLEKDPFALPEPKKFLYGNLIELSAREFSKLVSSASAISNELNFSINQNQFFISAKSGDYSYSGKPSKIGILQSDSISSSTLVISSYIKALGSLLTTCEIVRVGIDNDKPLRLELILQNKGLFTFILAHRRGKIRRKKTNRAGTSLPRLTVTRLPEFLVYLMNCPDGEELKFLRNAGLETEGGDHHRMTQKLNLTEKFGKKIKLTKSGEVFVNLLQNDPKQAKNFLHNLALKNLSSYSIMVSLLKEKPLNPQELFTEMNSKMDELNHFSIDRMDLSTLLGLSIWCGYLDKKLALYYMKTGEET